MLPSLLLLVAWFIARRNDATVERPQHMVAVPGENVHTTCTSAQNPDNTVDFYQVVTNRSTELQIGFASKADSYGCHQMDPEHYKVTSTYNGDTYLNATLTLICVTYNDAGTIKCSAKLRESTVDYISYVVIVEGRPMCHDNMIEGQVMNGSHFEIVCTLVYYGLFHPKLLIKDPTGVELQTTTEIDLWQRFRRGTITVNATMLAKSVHHMKTVEINVSYNISNEQHDTNFIAPKYNYAKFTTHSRRVFVCSPPVIEKPNITNYEVKSFMELSTEATPPIHRYECHDLVTNVVYHTVPLWLGDHHTGTVKFRCFAFSRCAGVEYNASVAFSTGIVEEESKVTLKMTITLLGVVCTWLLLGVMAVGMSILVMESSPVAQWEQEMINLESVSRNVSKSVSTNESSSSDEDSDEDSDEESNEDSDEDSD
ncbi:hypothetical protein LSAT2_015491 [Lamellibrachia satsuma]|nr:hypothetical protein LSAT2_015491 [Lamellibrachia satsuma]